MGATVVHVRHGILVVFLAVIFGITGLRVVAYEPTPWIGIVLASIGTFLLVGPVAWVLRRRIGETHRTHLGYAVTVVVMLLVPFVLGIGLLLGDLLVVLDVLVIGCIAGVVAAGFLEGTVVPPELRGVYRRQGAS